MIVLVIYIFPLRDALNQSGTKKRNQEALRKNEETRKYDVEQITMAQAKRDEQIRLLNELVELEKQSMENQKAILELLKSR